MSFHKSLIRFRRGVSIVYIIVGLTVMMGIMSLAIDVGRVQAAKGELQQAADAAARYGVAGLSQGVTTVKNRVVAAGAENKVDGQSLVIDSNNDIEFGVWDPQTKSFAVYTGSARAGATAIRVTVRRSAARGNGVPTLFASALGRSTVDVKAVAIASRGRVVKPTVEADSCPWLAGMPNGSQVAGYDGNDTPAVAPAQSPLRVNGLNLTAGTSLVFRSANGTTTYGEDGDEDDYGPDGNTDWIVAQQPVNGINTTQAPLNSLVGIFLDDRAPNAWAQSGSLNFSSTASRDFTTLSPGLKQVFFIGNGVNSSGQLQEFNVPSGATRLYLGIMDEKGWWWDNVGTLSITMMDETITLVK